MTSTQGDGYLTKSLKIPKRCSVSVNRIKSDNTMTKRKCTKGQTVISKTPHRKLKIEQQYLIPHNAIYTQNRNCLSH